eukprot:360246_1
MANVNKMQKNLIDQQFHKNANRDWVKATSTDTYTRYECKQVWCTSNYDNCWHISVHVHSSELKHLDRIYAFQFKSGQNAFMGAVEPMGKWTDYNLVSKEKITRPACKKWCTLYQFKKKNTVILQQIVDKFSIRANPKSPGQAAKDGSVGGWAQWEAQPLSNGAQIKLKSLKTGKYLRLRDSSTVDIEGTGGVNCPFKVKKDGSYTKLESVKFPGKYIAVDQNGVRVGTGGEWTRLKIYRVNK